KFKYGGKEKLKYAERIIDLYRSGKYDKLLTEQLILLPKRNWSERPNIDEIEKLKS
ncbi:1795_t:CDS:2, partial [Dentiscutata heterogama]